MSSLKKEKEVDLRFSKFREIMYRAYRRLDTQEHQLLYLFLELTHRCNLSCIHCGSDCSSDSDRVGMEEPDWERVIDYVAERFAPQPAITLTGGEPLLLDWIGKLGAHIHEKNMRWGFVTNGLLLNEYRMRSLEASGVESITISLDGAERTHDCFRGKDGAWSKAMQAISLLGMSPVHVKDVVTCVSPISLKELDGVASTLSSTGITSWRLFRIFPKGRALSHPDLYLDKEKYIELLEWIRSMRPSLARNGIELSLSCDGWIPYELDRQVRSMPFFCRSGIQIASILYDGTITGCPNNDRGFSQGNFFTDDFSYIWDHGFIPFRNRPWLKSTICATCKFYYGCRGGSMHSWNFGGHEPAQCWISA